MPLREQQMKRLAIIKATVARLRAAGVPILAGTDAPNPGTAHGASVHREVEMLVEAGLDEEEALAAATSRPAKAFGLADRGRIAPGMRADLVLVQGDPTADIAATRAIVRVFKAGRAVDRQAYRAAIETAAATPSGAPIAPGIVSDFEGVAIDARFGAGWDVSTDSMMGGKSTAETALVQESDGNGSLRVAGMIDGGLPFAWAGAIFYPGGQPFAPANLSAARRITFRARGDGGTYRLLLFAASLGRMPASESFTAGEAWQRWSFDLSSFNGVDGGDVQAILFTGGPGPGAFEFQIDDVAFEEDGEMSGWIDEGERAPDFTLPADDGGTVRLSQFRGRPVVLYFYPRDDTPGCTKEACAFRDRIAEVQELGAVVLGVSPDDVASHEMFRDKYALNFPLLADVDHEVATMYGAWRERDMYGRKSMGIQRSTFLIDGDGVVRRVWKRVQVDGHDQEVIDAVRALGAGGGR
jgi:peroxiredoxin